MNTNARLFVAVMSLLFASTLVHAGTVPITVYPNPVQFGTVARSTTATIFIYLTNDTSNPAVITTMSITGTNASSFALPGNACLGTIAANETCSTNVTFTPSLVGGLDATLVISVQGDSTPITIALEGTGGAPLPVITTLSPASVYVNSTAITLTVNGTGFVSGDVIYFDYNTPLTTTYVSPTKLTAIVPASFFSYLGTEEVFVSTVSGATSNNVYFTVISLTPQLQSVSPPAVTSGSVPTAIVVIGNNFMNGATVQLNGKTHPTTYTSTSELQFTPTKGDLANAAIDTITVTNPRPGGISQSLNFNVTYPATVTTLDLPANDIVWDPYAQLIYASLPSSYGPNGNSVAVINPATGKVTGYYFAGSEPHQLALSADSQYLYVGLNGNGSVQRLILPGFTPDIDVSLGTNSGTLNIADQILVDPADDHTWAAVVGSSYYTNGLYFYKDSAQLPDFITYPYVDSAAWVDSTTLYGFGSGTISQVAVNSSGGTVTQQWSNTLEGTTINYAAGLIYGNDGRVFNPSTGLLVGSYYFGSSNCCSYNPILPDPAINRFFAVGVTAFLDNFDIASYNLSQFTPVAETNLSQFQEQTTTALIPWGSSGMAFIFTACCQSAGLQTVLVKSSGMLMSSSTSSNPVPAAQSLSPASATHGTSNTPVTINGTGFVPGSQVTWNGASLYAAYVSPTQLTLYVPYSDLASVGAAQIVVTNPAPGGGKSAALTFTIN